MIAILKDSSGGINRAVFDSEDAIKSYCNENALTYEIEKPNTEQMTQRLFESKIAAFSAACQQTIYNGLDITLSDGSTEHYDYKALDQTNVKSMFDGVANLGITAFPYQSEDGNCRVYSAADIIIIYTSLEQLRVSQITYYNQLKKYVSTLTTVEDIDAVTYGQPLTGEYLSHYNDMVAVAMEQMQQAIARRVTTNAT